MSSAILHHTDVHTFKASTIVYLHDCTVYFYSEEETRNNNNNVQLYSETKKEKVINSAILSF